MQEARRRYTEEVRHTHGVEVQIRVGLNSGAVVVRAIGDDLHMDYAAVGQTTHLAARMEQLAPPGSIRLTADTLRLVEGFVQVTALGLVPVKGLTEPVAVWELVGVTSMRRRLQAAVARGLSPFVGRQPEVEALQQALARAEAGQGQVVALIGEPGVGKSRLVYEFLHSHHTQGWLILESSSVSYGKATAYLPVCDLLPGRSPWAATRPFAPRRDPGPDARRPTAARTALQRYEHDFLAGRRCGACHGLRPAHPGRGCNARACRPPGPGALQPGSDLLRRRRLCSGRRKS